VDADQKDPNRQHDDTPAEIVAGYLRQAWADTGPNLNWKQRACGKYGLASRTLEFGDLELVAGEEAGAIPPGSIPLPAREHFGGHAPRVARVGECVCARC
jgi:hypothetical protein